MSNTKSLPSTSKEEISDRLERLVVEKQQAEQKVQQLEDGIKELGGKNGK
jgi:hypothetical protein